MILVVAQIGLTVVVITAAGLVLHSLYKLTQVDPGFRTDRTITAEVALDAATCRDRGHCQAFFETLIEHATAIPGVDRVALADILPLNGRHGSYVFDAEDHPRDARQNSTQAAGRIVSPGYFDVLGLQLLRGRLLNEQDASSTTHAVVINEQMAEQLWPHQDPLGKHVLDVKDESAPSVWNSAMASVIVGVVRNAREGSLASDLDYEVYLPMTRLASNP